MGIRRELPPILGVIRVTRVIFERLVGTVGIQVRTGYAEIIIDAVAEHVLFIPREVERSRGVVGAHIFHCTAAIEILVGIRADVAEE